MPAPDDRLFTPRFFVMCGFTFTVFLSAFQLLPTAPFHILDLGGTTFASGLFLGFLTYSSAFSAPLTGAYADRIGHRRMLIISSVALAVFAAAYSVITDYRLVLALARLVLPAEIHVQAPPNLSEPDQPGHSWGDLLDAGIDDWGGISPVTIDHVNPERPWPGLDALREATQTRGLALAPRLTIYPEFAARPDRWLDPALTFPVLDRADEFKIDRFLPEPIPQNVAGVASEPFPRLPRVGDVHLDQCQHVSVDDASVPPKTVVDRQLRLRSRRTSCRRRRPRSASKTRQRPSRRVRARGHGRDQPDARVPGEQCDQFLARVPGGACDTDTYWG